MFSSKIYVVLTGFAGLFLCYACSRFSKRFLKTIRVFLSSRDYQCHLPFNFLRLSQSCLLFKDYHSLFSYRDNNGHLLLYFSKTIRVFGRVETIMVICLFIFQRLQCLLTKTTTVFFVSKTIMSVGLQRPSRSSALYFSKEFIVFCQDYHSLFYILKTIKVCHHAETIMVICFLYFSKTIIVYCHAKTIMVICFIYLSKTNRVLCQDYQCILYFSKTIKVCCLAETINFFRPFYFFKDHQSLLFQRLSKSSVETLMSPLLCKTSRSFVDIPNASYAPSFDRFHCLGFH